MAARFGDDYVRKVFEAGAFVLEDGTPYIDKSEVIVRLQALGLAPQPSMLDDLMTEIDTNQDGVIDFAEFLHYYKRTAEDPLTHPDEGQIRAMFELFDEDGNGFLDKEEFRSALRQAGDDDGLTDAEIDFLFDQADQMGGADDAGDGRLNMEEFIQFILKRNAVQDPLGESLFVGMPDEEDGRQETSDEGAPAQPPPLTPPPAGLQPPAQSQSPTAAAGSQLRACVEVREALSSWEDRSQRLLRTRLPFGKVRKGLLVSMTPSHLAPAEGKSSESYTGEVLGTTADRKGVRVKWAPPHAGGPPEAPEETVEPREWWEGNGRPTKAALREDLPESRTHDAQWSDRWGRYRLLAEYGGAQLSVGTWDSSEWLRLGTVREIKLSGSSMALLGQLDRSELSGLLAFRVAATGCRTRVTGSEKPRILADIRSVADRVEVKHNIPTAIQVDQRQLDVDEMVSFFKDSHVTFLSYRGEGPPEPPRRGGGATPTPGPALKAELSRGLSSLPPQLLRDWRAIPVRFTAADAGSDQKRILDVTISERDFRFMDVRRLVCDAFGTALNNAVMSVPGKGGGRRRLVRPATEQGGGWFVRALLSALGVPYEEALEGGPVDVAVDRQPDVIIVRTPTSAEVLPVNEQALLRACKATADQGGESLIFKRRANPGSKVKVTPSTSSFGINSHIGITKKSGADIEDSVDLRLNVVVAPLRDEAAPADVHGIICRVLTSVGQGNDRRGGAGALPFRCGALLDVSEFRLPSGRPFGLYRISRSRKTWWRQAASVVCTRAVDGSVHMLCTEFTTEGLYYIADAECELVVDESWLWNHNNKDYEAKGPVCMLGGQPHMKPWGFTRKGLNVMGRDTQEWACLYCTSDLSQLPFLLAPRPEADAEVNSGRVEDVQREPGDAAVGTVVGTPSLELTLNRSQLQTLSLLQGSDSAELRDAVAEKWLQVPAPPHVELPQVTVLCRVDYSAVSARDHLYRATLPFVDESFLGRTDLQWHVGDLSKIKPHGICYRRQQPTPFAEVRRRVYSLGHYCGEANSGKEVSVEVDGAVTTATVENVLIPAGGGPAKIEIRKPDGAVATVPEASLREPKKESRASPARARASDGSDEPPAPVAPRPPIAPPEAVPPAAVLRAPEQQRQVTIADAVAEPQSSRRSEEISRVSPPSSSRPPRPPSEVPSSVAPQEKKQSGGCCGDGCSVQ
eukprot:TRINITY_DN30328_c0_g1_i1.p1 TRINITY_DN30328_c0_g1~~TRINITY_DN30328_c0_g1_i1.p1  ORF type:complete len:1194 (+),score=329.71 TRINITY_DN30328_c0_g1_i1:55-3636(+)